MNVNCIDIETLQTRLSDTRATCDPAMRTEIIHDNNKNINNNTQSWYPLHNELCNGESSTSIPNNVKVTTLKSTTVTRQHRRGSLDESLLTTMRVTKKLIPKRSTMNMLFGAPLMVPVLISLSAETQETHRRAGTTMTPRRGSLLEGTMRRLSGAHRRASGSQRRASGSHRRTPGGSRYSRVVYQRGSSPKVIETSSSDTRRGANGRRITDSRYRQLSRRLSRRSQPTPSDASPPLFDLVATLSKTSLNGTPIVNHQYSESIVVETGQVECTQKGSNNASQEACSQVSLRSALVTARFIFSKEGAKASEGIVVHG